MSTRILSTEQVLTVCECFARRHAPVLHRYGLHLRLHNPLIIGALAGASPLLEFSSREQFSQFIRELRPWEAGHHGVEQLLNEEFAAYFLALVEEVQHTF